MDELPDASVWSTRILPVSGIENRSNGEKNFTSQDFTRSRDLNEKLNTSKDETIALMYA